LALIRATRGPGPSWRRWRRQQQLLELIDKENKAREEQEALRLQRETKREQKPEPAFTQPEADKPAPSKRERRERRTTNLTYEAIQRAKEELRFRQGKY
jgi:hypothetical protein